MASAEKIAALLQEAHRWVGTRYEPHACLRGVGCDCAQLLIGVAIAAGVVDEVTVRQDYSVSVPEGGEYVDTILKFCDDIDETDATAGDLVLFKNVDPSHLDTPGWLHSGIVVSWPEHVIHATLRRGVISSHGTEDFLRTLPRRFFRLR